MCQDYPVAVPPKPWTQGQIKQLRDAIVCGEHSAAGLDYDEVYLWYSDILMRIVDHIGTIDFSQAVSSRFVGSFRVKTVTTLRDKLIRQPKTPLPRIHDVIGVRLVANMTLDEQSRASQVLAQAFPNSTISDIRSQPHSGYRAVHVILHMPRGIFAEVQVRTLLQDKWANCYETLADVSGRRIRYGPSGGSWWIHRYHAGCLSSDYRA